MKKLSLIFLLFTSVAFAQETLTNDGVIALVNSGLSPAIVIAKIKAAEPKFDTSAPALVKLADAKVPEAIIVAMIDRQGAETAQIKKIDAKDDRDLSDIPEQGSISELKPPQVFYISTDNIKARDRIAKELVKAGYTAVDAPEKTDGVGFVVMYREREDYVVGSPYLNKVGELFVWRVSGDAGKPGRRRNLYSAHKEKFYVFTAEPAQATAQQFVSDLRKAGVIK